MLKNHCVDDGDSYQGEAEETVRDGDISVLWKIHQRLFLSLQIKSERVSVAHKIFQDWGPDYLFITSWYFHTPNGPDVLKLLGF